ncbi:MAG: DUF3996 domain-containing protein [Ignavibacteriae bacterium]|nr:DUF3996 domain-containing protein [Ignavibacteria bacterium]MBI3365823.1 DUF3996 domain-containing protein [Ignavibacteriota bacterium]
MKNTLSYRFTLIVALAVLLLAPTAAPGQGKFGVGFVVGDPTGVAWKYKLNANNALDGAIGFSPFDRYRLHVDYLWHSNPFHEQNLALHYGAGVAFGFGRTEYIVVNDGRSRYLLRDQEIGFGVRGVIGLTYRVQQSPVELFFEAAPLVIVSPAGGMGVDVGLGVRFYP